MHFGATVTLEGYNIHMSSFEEIDHTADWAFRVSAPTLEGLFLTAVEAMYQLGGMQTAPAQGTERVIRLESEDREGLLVAWLNEMLFLLEHDRLVLRDLVFEKFSPTEILARGTTAPVVASGKYIKAATYSGLKILQSDAGWEATIVLDV